MPNLESENFILFISTILSGFIFLISNKVTRYYSRKLERQKTIYYSIISGIFFVFISNILLVNFSYLNFATSFESILAFKHIYFLVFTLFISFLISLLTYFLPKKYCYKICIKLWGNEMDLLIFKSFDSKNISEKVILICLNDSKVYIGFIYDLNIPIYDELLTIYPLGSGYRDSKTRELKKLHLYNNLFFETPQNINYKLVFYKSSIISIRNYIRRENKN